LPDVDPELPTIPEGAPRKSPEQWREDAAAMYAAEWKPVLALVTVLGARDPENTAEDVLLKGTDYLWYPQDPKKMPALLATIARNRLRNERRDAFRRGEVPLEEGALAESALDPLDPEQAAAKADEMRAAGKAFEELRAEHPDRAEQFKRVYVDDVPAAEIAAETGEKQDAVRKRLSRTRASLLDRVLDHLGKRRRK
jgi:RNA polymerase sigma factor (sigma-70 family)